MAHPYTQEKLPYDMRARSRADRAGLRHGGGGERAGRDRVQDRRRIRHARQAPSPEKYHAAGAAGVPEFVLGAFLKTENLDVTKVPYRDVVQAGRDLGESRIHFLLSSYAVVRPLIEADKVRVVARRRPQARRRHAEHAGGAGNRISDAGDGDDVGALRPEGHAARACANASPPT